MINWESIRDYIRRLFDLRGKTNREIQPRDILDRLYAEVERRKKLGIEENAFVPNVYVVYLSPYDYEEISYLLTGIKEQLKNKLMERIKARGYKVLSSVISLDIRQDSGLMNNQIVIESSFLKEKTPVLSDDRAANNIETPVNIDEQIKGLKEANDKIEDKGRADDGQDIKNAMTRIVEDKKTKIQGARIGIEIIEGQGKGDIIRLQEGEYTFGRGRDAQILITDDEETVSRMHFKISVRNGRLHIRDLNSANGTKVNEIEIEESELKKGDTIKAGKVLLKVA